MIAEIPARRPWFALLLLAALSAAAILGSRREPADRQVGSTRVKADVEFTQ